VSNFQDQAPNIESVPAVPSSDIVPLPASTLPAPIPASTPLEKPCAQPSMCASPSPAATESPSHQDQSFMTLTRRGVLHNDSRSAVITTVPILRCFNEITSSLYGNAPI
ncbi:hypothetical protein CCACVL1_10775, partial [Corchorus capsularis]